MDNLIPTILNIKEIQLLIAGGAKELRLEKGFKRETLASMAGVSVSTLKHFETTGEVSLKTLLMISSALGRTADFIEIFKEEEYKSIKEIEESMKKKPKRGRL
jgi:transcriptional regulator with XRE-family HTH domain